MTDTDHPRSQIRIMTCDMASAGYTSYKNIRAIGKHVLNEPDARSDKLPAYKLQEFALVMSSIRLAITAEEFNAFNEQEAIDWYMSTYPKRRTFFKEVLQFNVAAGVIAAIGQQFDPKLVAFYTGMQCEELAEKLEWIFTQQELPLYEGRDFAEQLIADLELLGKKMKDGNADFIDAISTANRKELLDADVDLLVVSEGAILSSGADGDGARREVNRSNLEKIVDGKVIRDPVSGKILKPEGWTPPNLLPFICTETATPM